MNETLVFSSRPYTERTWTTGIRTEGHSGEDSSVRSSGTDVSLDRPWGRTTRGRRRVTIRSRECAYVSERFRKERGRVVPPR